ncbi:hypothetical protein [Frigoriglobus tundricola]|uniref:Uncharacterized protein n=1 Tax=Frigoriglobus tundricola TaxID=2774151 RepID=A0A6M5YX17_9BACT|nr:hypothetical protein [Frigoriglobus tundricola]QJW98468.1 hypothetical protein FTUN_6058 [Frigoriglobus tundricola]
MGDQVWQVPQEQFVAAWNGAESLADASVRVKELAGVYVPGWALMVRAMSLRKEGVVLKALVRATPLPA